MQLQQEKSFLGRGWAFPPRFNNQTQAAEMVSDELDIEESLFLLLSTTPGERVMRPSYGCDLQSMVFEQIDLTTISRIKDLIAYAILHFEPRITLEDIKVDTRDHLEGVIRIHLEYTIRTINVRTNIVYPYYFIEGTNIREI